MSRVLELGVSLRERVIACISITCSMVHSGNAMPGLPLYLRYPNSAFTSRPTETLKKAIRDWSRRL